MEKLDEFGELKEKYHVLFERLLKGYNLVYNIDDEFIFFDENGNQMSMVVFNGRIFIHKDNSMELVELPCSLTNYIRSIETTNEEYENGVINNEVQRFYFQVGDDNDYYVTDLYQITTYYNKNFESINDDFECHSRRNGYSVKYNNKDISFVYHGVDGPMRVEKIFDLYNGNVTPLVFDELKLIEEDKLDSNCFDYKRHNGLKERAEKFLSGLFNKKN